MQQPNEPVLLCPPFIGLSSDEPVSREQRKILTKHAIAAITCAKLGRRMPTARQMLCVDCGIQADVYDHRDYLRPLEVEPVCMRCNHRRGPAKPYTNFKRNFPKPLDIDPEVAALAKENNASTLRAFLEAKSEYSRFVDKHYEIYFGSAYQNAELFNLLESVMRSGEECCLIADHFNIECYEHGPEAQARINAAAKAGRERYWTAKRAMKQVTT